MNITDFTVICHDRLQDHPDFSTETNKPSLLITDDDDSFRETLVELFEPEGFRTLQAADGNEAVAIIRRESVDLALLDMHMPYLNGLDTIQIVRRLQPRIPCILLSAALDDLIRRRAEELATFSVLSKPISRKELFHAVFAALQTIRT